MRRTFWIAFCLGFGSLGCKQPKFDILAELDRVCAERPNLAACIDCAPKHGTSEYAICLENSDLADLLAGLDPASEGDRGPDTESPDPSETGEASTDGGADTVGEPAAPSHFTASGTWEPLPGASEGERVAYSLDLREIRCEWIVDLEAGTEELQIWGDTDAPLENVFDQAGLFISRDGGFGASNLFEQDEEAETAQFGGFAATFFPGIGTRAMDLNPYAPRGLRWFMKITLAEDELVGTFGADDLCAQRADERSCTGSFEGEFACDPAVTVLPTGDDGESDSAEDAAGSEEG